MAANFQPHCPACGEPFTSSEPDDLCPRCLLRGLLDPAHTAAPVAAGPEPKRGDLVGDYELIEPLGRGGMGVVWRARQRSLNRIVALKMIRTGEFAGPEEVRRFRNEAESAALLDHPNLVPIYEIGEAAGRHFFSMRLAESGSLATEPPQHRAPREAAALLAKVARAVHFAHLRGVLHRDLKPGNILLGLDGEPLVADFGLARRLGAESDLTLTGEILGSPAYMAPEQAAGKPDQVTTAADIYSLGAILFELLAGTPPFTGPTPLATLRRAAEQEPPRLRSLNPQVERDLETICLRCLAKQPAARYASALALAEDLERLLRNEPIHARPASTGERFAKWTRRHPAAAGLVGLAILAPLVIIGVLLHSGARVRRFADETAQERDRTRENLYAADMFIAESALEDHDPKAAYEALAHHLPAAGKPDIRDFEWHWLWNTARGEAAAVFLGHEDVVTGVTFSPDGTWLASCAYDGTVRLWPVASNGSPRVLKFPAAPAQTPRVVAQQPKPDAAPVPLNSVSFSPDGRQLLACSSQGAALWDLATGTPPRRTNIQVFRGWFLPQMPPRMVLAEIRGTNISAAAVPQPDSLAFRDPNWREMRAAWRTQPYLFAVSGDERWLAESFLSDVRLWNLATGNLARRLELTRGLVSLALSPDGTRLATCGLSQPEVVLWDTATGSEVGTLRTPDINVQSVVFSPDSRLLATIGADKSVRLWEHAGRREIRRWADRSIMARALAFSPDSRFLATADADHAVRLWPVVSPAPPPPITNVTPPLAFSPDGRRIATGRSTNGFAVWDAMTHELLLTSELPALAALAWSRSGDAVLTASLETGQAKVEIVCQPLKQGEPCRVVKLAEGLPPTACVAFDARRAEVITGHQDGSLCWWNLDSGAPLATNRAGTNAWRGLAFAPGGQRLASWAGMRPTLLSWDVEARRPLGAYTFPRFCLLALAFRPDGSVIATGGDLSAVNLWTTDTLHRLDGLPEQRANVNQLAWSPRGRTLAIADLDGSLRLWHVPTSRRMLDLWTSPAKAKERITALAFSPAGDWLAATDSRRELHLWAAPAEATPNRGR